MADLSIGTTDIKKVSLGSTEVQRISVGDMLIWTAEITSLAAPTNIHTQSVSSSSITVDWDGVPGAERYDVRYRRTGTTSWTTLQDTTATQRTISGLSSSTSYQFQVQAETQTMDGIVESSWAPSTPVTRTTAAPAATVPGRVSTPTASSITTSSVTVTWSAPSSGGSTITDYDVQYREGTSGNFTSVAHSGTSRTRTITGLGDDQLHQVQVRAGNSVGEGAWSQSRDFTTAEIPAWPQDTLFSDTGYWMRISYTASSNERLTSIGSPTPTERYDTDGSSHTLPSQGNRTIQLRYSSRPTSMRAIWAITDIGTQTISNIRYWNGSSWVSLSATVGEWISTGGHGNRYATWSLP